MAQYFVLFFKNSATQEAKIESWSCEESTPVTEKTPLLTYLSGGKSFTLKSPVAGILKVQLYPEGQPLVEGSEVAVLSVEDREAREAVAAGYGKVITPEELDETISHAEAASIRLPPQHD